MIELSATVVLTLVRLDPSTAGSFALPSSCTILLAVVPTSTLSVPDPVIGPPVKPVPEATLVTVPEPDTAPHEISVPSDLSTCPLEPGASTAGLPLASPYIILPLAIPASSSKPTALSASAAWSTALSTISQDSLPVPALVTAMLPLVPLETPLPAFVST